MVDSSDPFIKMGLTAIILIMALPGLVIEPGPISEVVALAGIGTVWGVDFDGGDGG